MAGAGPRGGGAGESGSGFDSTHAGNVSSGGISGHGGTAMGGWGGFGGLGIGNPGSYGGLQSVGSPGFSMGYHGGRVSGSPYTDYGLPEVSGWGYRPGQENVGPPEATWGDKAFDGKPDGILGSIGYNVLSALENVKERPGSVIGGILSITTNPVLGALAGLSSNLLSGWAHNRTPAESVGKNVVAAAPSAVTAAALSQIGEIAGGPIGRAVMSGIGGVLGKKVGSVVANSYSDWAGTPEVEAAGSSVYTGDLNTRQLINALALRKSLERSGWQTTA